MNQLVSMLYERNDFDFHRGTFRVRGDVVEIFPAYEEDQALRISFFGDSIESHLHDRSLTGEKPRTGWNRSTSFPTATM